MVKRNRIWKLKIACEKMKIELSRNNVAEIQLKYILGEDFLDECVYITREEFEEKCKETLMKRFEKCISDVVIQARLNKNEIDLVVPLGGSCNIPIVRATLASMFPHSQHPNPKFDTLSAVTKGAAYQAYLNRNGLGQESHVSESIIAMRENIERFFQ